MDSQSTKPTALVHRVVRRTERGWGGHFICSYRCMFRRNTLIECGGTRIVVSTVGSMRGRDDAGLEIEMIGDDRHYETMAFHAKYDGRYWDADVSRQVFFDSPCVIADWNADDVANDMHEKAVAEISGKLERGETVA